MKKITFRITLVGLCTMIASVTTIAALGLQYYFSKQLAIDASQVLTKQITQQIETSVKTMDDNASNVVSVVAKYSTLLVEGNAVKDKADSVLVDILNNNNNFYAMYYGFENGDFYEIINLETNESVRDQLGASYQDRYVRIWIFDSDQGRIKRTDYLDANLKARLTRVESSDYYATTRHWFKDAGSSAVHKSKPYLFQHLNATGTTYSRLVDGTNHVFAVDMTLETIAEQLSQLLQINNQNNTNKAYVFGENGELLISNQRANNEKISIAPLDLNERQKSMVNAIGNITISNETDWAPIDFAVAGEPKGYSPEIINVLVKKLGMQIDFVNGYSWLELVASYQNNEIDVLQPVRRTEENADWGYYSKPILDLPLAIATTPDKPEVKSLSDLANKKLAIPSGWSFYEIVKAEYPNIEIYPVDNSVDALRAVKEGKVYGALDSLAIHDYTSRMFFIDGLIYHSDFENISDNFDSRLRLVSKNKDVIDLFNLAIDSLTAAEIKTIANKWLNTTGRFQVNESSQVPYERLLTISKSADLLGNLQIENINGTDYLVYVTETELGAYDTNFLALMLPTKDIYAEGLQYVTKSILITLAILSFLIPITWLVASPIVRAIKDLTVENEKIKERKYSELQPQTSFIVEIDDVFKSLIDMSDSIQAYEKRHKELLDSFVKLIAQAIDDKSPYTAGHCNRVPELGLMLANVASKDKTDYFSSFELDTEDKQREFRLAAWLHDCGKIITPEHIVDKGSKLECIYNRIHEVRMRFEVLWRDTEIAYLKALAISPDDKETLLAVKERQQHELIEEFDFIAKCNQGGEFMEESRIKRLETIGARQWTRHFSDKVGLSPLEELKIGNLDESLPVQETLLADKPTHIVERDALVEYPPHLGINIEVPELKANLGELYNLKIGRGTLTPEDRFIINEHMIGTIKMLDSMPFPEELSMVPRYASTHHETLKGTGYPRKLTGDDLSIPERILVLADIFEALTASDRPYKKAKPLSVAIDILHKMCLDDHVDIEVFKLFLVSGTHLEYAKRYLPEWQVDHVDIDKYFSKDVA
ncbi:transporter substrate-binding domain-containing protein [Thalassotalea sp. LPB0316]|uniref:HD domain-containing phosphohydrolase n=1 Tax=Thalassotalea sp. LPB0316 TaxID=2769490 RepID=UPI0018674B72|nr:HD domain-containing phosphohydrolase [Thalassotalea sp. LPB0316]QOL24934.1 transporter substrate-binding domain-containing protein [Thalassotalea sp. LPB0316]